MSVLTIPPIDLDLLTDVVTGLAAVPELWRTLVVHDPVERGKVRLLGTEEYEVWLLGWCPGQRVELHDHGGSAAAFVAVEGDLVELRADPAGLLRRTALTPGVAHTAPIGTIHDVVNLGRSLATSIHAYAPPLTSMGFYPEGPAAVPDRQPVVDIAPLVDPRRLARQLHPAVRTAPRTAG